MSDCRLLVAGAARNGSTAEYQRLVPPSCRKHLFFLGLIEDDERADLYASADLFVLPARFGGSFSIMALEALAAGVPIVSTPFVSRAHRGRHWQTVYLYDDYSLRAIGEKITLALQADNTRRIAQGRTIVEEYDWEATTRQILAVYAAALAG